MARRAPDLAARRAALLDARARIDRALADLDAGAPTGSPERARGARGGAPSTFVPLKTAAAVWGVSGPAAWKRARRLEPAGLAVRLTPGGWRVRVDAL